MRRRASTDDFGDSLLPDGLIEGFGRPWHRRWWLLRHPWLTAILVAIVVGVATTLFVSLNSLKVTGVYAYQASRVAKCQGVATVRGDIDTNGMTGTVRYEWVRPDGTRSAVTSIDFSFGQSARQVQLTWIFPPSENGVPVTTTLRVLTPNVMSTQARLFYFCF